MNDKDRSPKRDAAADAIRRKAKRKDDADKQGPGRGVWFGIGMFGLVGWAVAVPTLAGIVLGMWLDRVVPVGFSWTLALLLAGVLLGCVNAWWWINKESRND